MFGLWDFLAISVIVSGVVAAYGCKSKCKNTGSSTCICCKKDKKDK